MFDPVATHLDPTSALSIVSEDFSPVSVIYYWSFHQLLTSQWTSHQFTKPNQQAHLSDTSAAVISSSLCCWDLWSLLNEPNVRLKTTPAEGAVEFSKGKSINMSASVLCQHYNDFGDIIKETIYRSRQVDKMESAAALVLCLQQVKLIPKVNMPTDLWRALTNAFISSAVHSAQAGAGERRGSLSWSPDIHGHQRARQEIRPYLWWSHQVSWGRGHDPLVSAALEFCCLFRGSECCPCVVHRNGIEFVFQEFSQTPETPAPPYLSYLAILSEFSCKLLKPDKKTV